MIRILDFLIAFIGIVISTPFLMVLCICIAITSGSPLFLQQRVGKNQRPFTLVKMRTMRVGTKSVASHLANSTDVTKIGKFLRMSKLDELPQLWNVLKGDMSLVGPRPNLFNQIDLINARKAQGVYDVRPGITGLAQINNIDMSTPEKLAEVDAQMIRSMNVHQYFYYIFRTLFGAGSGDAVR